MFAVGVGGRISVLKPDATANLSVTDPPIMLDLTVDHGGATDPDRVWFVDAKSPFVLQIGEDAEIQALPETNPRTWPGRIFADENSAWVLGRYASEGVLTEWSLHRWDGARWIPADVVFPVVGPAASVDGNIVNGVLWLLVGDQVSRVDRDGVFEVLPAPPNNGLRSIYAAADDEVWIAGSDAFVARWDGTAFETIPVDVEPEKDLQLVRGAGRSIWLLTGGQVFQRSQGGWVTHEVGDIRHPRGMAVPAPNDVWVATLNTLYHWDGGRWTEHDPGIGEGIEGVAVGDSHVYVSTWSGIVKGPRRPEEGFQ